MPLLELNGVTKHFGGVVAVSDLDLVVERGVILGLIGPNGAGKTTAFNLVSGVLRPTKGCILFDGVDITGWKTHRVAQYGLVRTFQHTLLVPDMTVLENISLGFTMASKAGLLRVLANAPSMRERERSLLIQAREVAEFMGLGAMQDELACNLPHGCQRALGMAMALGTKPRLLLLDEPITGLNAEETLQMMARIRDTRSTGTTILLVEHHMDVVMSMCDRICVLNFGRKIAEGTPKEILEDNAVIDAYLGDRYAAKR